MPTRLDVPEDWRPGDDDGMDERLPDGEYVANDILVTVTTEGAWKHIVYHYPNEVIWE